jgi:hypothetical protein
MNKQDKIETLNSIIDELKYENRKVEFSSAVERLTKRVVTLEEQIELIKTILKKHYE